MNICAARDQGPSSAGMARHLAPFSWRQRMAEMVRRRSFGCVLPLGRHASTNGSKFVHCASDTIALSSFQKEQNARHHKQFKREQALVELRRGFAFKSEDYVEAGILNFRVSNVGRPPEDLGDVKFLPGEFLHSHAEFRLEGNQILLVMVGATVGKIGRVPPEVCPALLNQNMWHLY